MACGPFQFPGLLPSPTPPLDPPRCHRPDETGPAIKTLPGGPARKPVRAHRVAQRTAAKNYRRAPHGLETRVAMIEREDIVQVLEGYDPSKIRIAISGSRNLLRSEEREFEKSYYWILEKAKLPTPEKFEQARDIDGLAIVKLPHRIKKLERGFFTAASYPEFREKSQALLKQGVISEKDLKDARIERYIIGPIFNFDFFYSPIEDDAEKLELLGIDWRFETSLDGHVRLPAEQQRTLDDAQRIPEYVVVGHNAATLRESSLNDVFAIAERYVKATQQHFPPGIIGPFTLQTAVDKDLQFWVYDVSPRIGGGTNVHMSVGHPYGNSLWRRPMSTARRSAREIRRGLDTGRLGELVT